MSLTTYREHKLTGHPFFPSVPRAWTVAKLRNAVESLASGGTPDTSDERYWSDSGTGVPWVSIGDMSREQVIRETEKNITDLGRATRRLEVFPSGTLLLSMYASLGKTAVLGVPATVNQAILAIRPSSATTTSFLKWWFSFLQPHIDQFSSANTQANLSAARVAALPLCLPSLSEQASIAAFLDRETAKIDALIAEQERLIALLQEKRQAVISHAVTKGLDPNVPMKDSGVAWIGLVPGHWQVTRCSRHLTIIPGFAFPAADFSEDEADTKLLRGINVGVSSIRWDDVVYWTRNEGDGLDRYSLREGDVVLGMDRPMIGAGVRIATISASDLPCLLLQRVALLRPDESLDGQFLRNVLSTSMFAAHFLPETTGVSVPHISPDQISSFVLALPPKEEQLRIVDYLSQETSRMSATVSEAEAALALLRERRTALITAAVTGQIDVRGLVETAA